MSVRAKFQCNSVEQTTSEPVMVTRSGWDGTKHVETQELSWPRTYLFSPQYDATIPEDERYARYTPSGELRILVDNPAVEFTPGKQYYIDFTPVETSAPASE